MLPYSILFSYEMGGEYHMLRFVGGLLKYGLISTILGLVAQIPVLIILGIILSCMSLGLFYSSGYPKISGNHPFNTFNNKSNLGEFVTFCEIRNLGFNKILTNIYIPSRDENTTEIDLIALHRTGIYVFEVKNYSGWIFGSEYSKMWTQSLNRNVKNQFFNPIRQNFGHIESLKTFLKNDNTEAFHSYIVFSIRSEFKKIDKKSSDDIICLTKQNYVKGIVSRHIQSRKDIFSDSELMEIETLLLSQCLQDKKIKEQHIENIKRKLEK